jgi:hypothetical protein
MKGNLEFSEKKLKKSSLHMKENEALFEIEKYFDFLKMDKKNVQNKKARIFYEKSIPPYDN